MEKLVAIIKGEKKVWLINPKISEGLKQKIINDVLDTFNPIDWWYEEVTPSY